MNDPDSPDRPGHLDPGHGDTLSISDTSLAALLAGVRMPPGSAPQLRPLAESLALLTGRPGSDELDGEAATLAAFRREFGAASRVHRHRRRRAGRLLPVQSAAAAVAAGIFSFGGLAVAAYAGTLPAPLQQLAHDIIAAPAPHHPLATRPSPAGPAVRGHSVYGLCNAWAHAKANGTPAQRAAAFAKLATAAGGTNRVATYCAGITHPGTPASTRPHPVRSPQLSGKPTMVPMPRGSGQPSVPPARHGAGKPGGSHRTGKPAGLPTPRGSGKPSAPPIS